MGRLRSNVFIVASKGRTAATRRILLAQKTFANYIADEEALALQEPTSAIFGKPRASAAGQNRITATPSREASSSVAPRITSGGILPGPTSTNQGSGAVQAPTYPGRDPADARLLQSSVPTPPSEYILDALVSAPPLSYNAARALASSSSKPQRHFCEFCGYWGQIKCLKCGARVCGLVCKRAHDDERCQKYFG